MENNPPSRGKCVRGGGFQVELSWKNEQRSAAQKRDPLGTSVSLWGGLNGSGLAAAFQLRDRPLAWRESLFQCGLVAPVTEVSPQHHGTTQNFTLST